MAHIVIMPVQHKHLGSAWQNVVERVVQLAANGRGGKSVDCAQMAREVDDVTVAVDRWGEAMEFTLRPLRTSVRIPCDGDERHHG
jgi:hypothetical protein